MVDTDGGWSWFHFPADGDGVPDGGREEEREASLFFARCFLSPDGRRVLDHLRAMTLGRSAGPHASEALLRHLEGQRQLVLYIQALVRKGSTGAAS